MPFTNKSGVAIHYETEGHFKNPPLLFVHGNGNCLDDWYKLGFVEKLCPYFYLILIDMRGFGESDKPIHFSMYTAELVIRDIIAVLDELNIPSVHYFGNSRGGSLAFAAAKWYPHRFLSYLIGSAQPFGRDEPQLADSYVAWLSQGMSFFVHQVEKALGKPFPSGVRENYLRNNPLAMIAVNQAQTDWPNNSDCFINNKTPRTLLYGELDELAPLNQRYAAQDPICESIIFKGLTHAQTYWNSNIVAPAIIDFIKRHYPEF